MIEIVKEKKKWDALVKGCDSADFYHTYDYHHASKVNGEEPVLIHYHDKNRTILLPLLFRDIEYSLYKDATSVYGYPGPITQNVTSKCDFSDFRKEIQDLFEQQNIVSIFSRLNSFIPNQEHCLFHLGQTETLGRVVYIDLTKSLEEQWGNYFKRLRTYINKSRSIYTIRHAETDSDIDTFISLYHENMVRVNANKEYLFDKKYFLDLLESPHFDTELLLAIQNKTGKIAGGALFTKKDAYIQYHLSGTSEQYLDLNPVKLLIDEMRIRGTHEKYRYFNLGGGVGSKEDSLFYFKSGFSKDTFPFRVWKYTVNKEIYQELVEQKNGLMYCDNLDLRFFPQYRASVVHK
ncbi:GNAT family N-acetyltransferase [Flagellimonas flava]|uniref:GNAT family N-acetyltransferase n=1 Tax=Flagellimonas flava TaxID=570519 RepID=UPI003D65E313